MPRRAGSSGGEPPGFLVSHVIPWYVAVATVAVGVAVIGTVVQGAAPGHENGCFLHLGAALSASEDFFLTEVAPGCVRLTIAEAREALTWDFPFIALYAGLGTLALRWLWPRAWRIHRVRVQLEALAWLPAAAGVFDVVENVLVLRALRADGGALSLVGVEATAAGVVGWWKWAFGAPALLLSAGAVLAALANAVRALAKARPPAPAPAVRRDDPPCPPRDEIGIALSGGGIRAAGLSLGAMRALDRRRLFHRAGFVAAVSGGAYAAAAWFVGRGTAENAAAVRPQPAGGVDGLLDPPPGEPDLYSYLRAHRRYLGAGRGGAPANVVVGTLLLVLNLAVLGTLVALIAWPLGRLASSWLVQPDLQTFDYEGLSVQSLWIPDRLWWPGLGALAAAGLCFVGSWFLWDPARRRALTAAAVFGGLAVTLLSLLVALPQALAEAPKWLETLPWKGASGGAALLATLSSFGIGATLLRLARRPVPTDALRLGRILIAVPALLLPAKVATDAAYRDGFFAGSPRAYGAALAGFGVFYALASSQSWSLFRLHHRRMRTTFATTQDRSARARGAPGHAGVYPLSTRAEPEWPEYSGRPGPKLLVCAAAQQGEDSPEALRLTFSADAVEMREVAWDETGMRMNTVDYVVDAGAYVGALGKPWPGAPRLGTVSAAAALSGSALTSADRRQSLGTSSALLAAMNVRLGAWMPNPRRAGTGPLPPIRVGYLLKEILGVYDCDDPYVYVTDGQHWENLALVELIRRRCKWIFCIDGSSQTPEACDDPLGDARALAHLETGAEIDLDVSKLRAEDGCLPERSVAVGVVRYHTCGGTGPDDCDVGYLFYGKGVRAKDTSLHGLSFSLVDRLGEATARYDRFLGADEFDNLVRLGERLGRAVALEYDRLLRALAEGTPGDLQDTPALSEAYERFTGTYRGKRG